MVSLLPFQAGLERAFREQSYELSDNPRGDFLVHLRALGFRLDGVIADRIIRIPDAIDKHHKKSGWYIYREAQLDHGRIGIGAYGSFHGLPDRDTWVSKSVGALTTVEREQYNHALETAKAEEEKIRLEVQNETAENAMRIWKDAAVPSTAESAYCQRKKINIYPGVRMEGGDLIIPMVCAEKLFSLQRIKNEGDFYINGAAIGNKKFMSGGRKKGCYFLIEGGTDEILICEGYATGASLHAATSASVYISFDAGNLYDVCAYVKDIYSSARITVCADNDINTAGNPGLTKATQVAEGLGIEIKYPDGGGDFNDLHCEQGIEAVTAVLKSQRKTWKKKKSAAINLLRPSGILGNIVDYYHTTAGQDQPGFAIQCALAVCSVICSRNYASQFGSRSSLYFINIGKSGTGKEHAKKVMEMILDSCGLDHMIGGEGYSSGSAVLSALQDRPRHITVIDEFSKYLQSANNKNSNGLVASANTKLTEAFTKLGGKMRPLNYANTGVPKEKRKDMITPVANPAISLLCMTTPDDFFNNIGLAQVKDGFLNRFLIFISDAERTTYNYKERLEVPKIIIDWVEAIENRHGHKNDDFSMEPKAIILNCSFDAMVKQKEFDKWCIEYANSLDRFSMAELMSRANEISIRISLVHALSRNPLTEVIEAEDVEWATSYTRMCFETLVERAKMCMASSEFEGWKLECLRALREAGDNGYSAAELHVKKPFSKLRKNELRETLDALIQGEQVFMGVRKSGGKGRPVNVYLATGNEGEGK